MRIFKDVLSPVRFWMWSLFGASGWPRLLPHVPGHSARWGSFREWFMFFIVGTSLTSLKCVIDSSMSNIAGSLCRNLAFVPAPRAALRPVESEVIWGLRWGLPQVEFLTLQALRIRRRWRWIGLGPLQSGVHHPFPSVLPLTTGCWSLHRITRCGSFVRANPKDDRYAFPGRRECWAHVESSTTSRSFEVGCGFSVGVALVLSTWGD